MRTWTAVRVFSLHQMSLKCATLRLKGKILAYRTRRFQSVRVVVFIAIVSDTSSMDLDVHIMHIPNICPGSRQCQRHAWAHMSAAGYDKCSHRRFCTTMQILSIAWADLLSKHRDLRGSVTGWTLYCALYDYLDNYWVRDSKLEVPTIKEAIQKQGVKVTQSELQKLEGPSDIGRLRLSLAVEDRLDVESGTARLGGETALALFSARRLPCPALARFLAKHDFPLLTYMPLHFDDVGIADFIGRIEMMRREAGGYYDL